MTERSTDERLDHLSNTLDNFIFEASRLFARLGENQSRHDAAIDVLVQSVTRLTQSQETQWQIIKELQTDVREMQSEVKGLQVENRRILQRVFGDEL